VTATLTAPAPALDRTGFALAAATLGLTLFSIALSQIALGLTVIVWLAVVWRDRRIPALPAFMLPLVVYGAFTIVSSVFSPDPRASLFDSRQLLLWLVVPVVVSFARGPRAMTALDVVIALGAAGAVVGVVQYAMFGYDDLQQRPVGALSHYMTYSGVLMLVTCAAVARLLFERREWVWPAIAVPALLVALGATFARNAWIGAFVAVSLLLALRRPRLVLLAPVVALLMVAAAPESIQERFRSIADPENATNRDRVAMLRIGAAMVRDHPLFGVGPEMVEREYARYRPDDYVNPTNPHLHNVPVQIAAERGLPALAAWIWFVAVAIRDLVRRLRGGRAPALTAAALAGVVAMLTAGLFEYNFGDSEFLMLFLGLLTLPFAAAPDAPTARTA
jgi:O-antigen ligase